MCLKTDFDQGRSSNFFFFFEAPTFESQCWGPSKAKLTVIHSIVQTLESVSRSDHPLERTAA